LSETKREGGLPSMRTGKDCTFDIPISPAFAPMMSMQKSIPVPENSGLKKKRCI
jgi:hypothetical protein